MTCRPAMSTRGQVHRALGKAHGGAKLARHRAVAANGEGHPVPGAAGGDVRQVEGVDVVPLDDVRVALPNRPHQPLQHVLFGQPAGVDDVVPAAVVAQRNDHDAVLGPLGVRERPRLRHHFDVELHAVQVVERQVLEQRSAALHEVLLRRIGDAVDAGARLRLQVPHGVVVGRPGIEHDELAVGMPALQRLAAEALARKAAQRLEVGEKQEGVIGDVLRRPARRPRSLR